MKAGLIMQVNTVMIAMQAHNYQFFIDTVKFFNLI